MSREGAENEGVTVRAQAKRPYKSLTPSVLFLSNVVEEP